MAGGEEPQWGEGGGAAPPQEGLVKERPLPGGGGVALVRLCCHRCKGSEPSGVGPCNRGRLWACRTRLS